MPWKDGQLPGREQMLERIRKALGRPDDRLGAKTEGLSQPLEDLAGVMPAIAPEDLLSKFEAELGNVAGSSCRVTNLRELDDALRTILAASQATAVVVSRNPLLEQLGVPERLRAWGKPVAVWPEVGSAPADDTNSRQFARACFDATVGITGVDFALAETGTLVVSSVTEGSQLASLAPPVHVALYRRNQLIGSLEEVLEKLPVPRNPDEPALGRSVVFITGTSRTADIEQILIRGVHGPREVHAILIEDSCLA
jgi:L-lactate dehydrogenase complex protein LldG